ncbi:hypothetical protein [Micrococcus sp.]|uniref:hypothetical protein n=1 Tax=Micrococcus sp. TaxID=1271 RepID=UPI002A9115FC|nr:hypothetical protein [Micrococcus sp.]MDY6055281.1 hypothetical protein [Micrococcus sp.]
MTLPPLHHGRDDHEAAAGRGTGGPGAGLRTAYVFVGVWFACSLIGFFSLRLLGVQRGEMSLPAALGVLAVGAAVAAVVTRSVRGR